MLQFFKKLYNHLSWIKYIGIFVAGFIFIIFVADYIVTNEIDIKYKDLNTCEKKILNLEDRWENLFLSLCVPMFMFLALKLYLEAWILYAKESCENAQQIQSLVTQFKSGLGNVGSVVFKVTYFFTQSAPNFLIFTGGGLLGWGTNYSKTPIFLCSISLVVAGFSIYLSRMISQSSLNDEKVTVRKLKWFSLMSAIIAIVFWLSVLYKSNETFISAILKLIT